MLPLLVTLAVTRLLVLCLLPAGAYSQDIAFFVELGNLVASNQNPYNMSPPWTYSPFTGELVWGFSRISRLTGIELQLALKIFNVLCEMLLACGVYCSAKLFAEERAAFTAALLGVALNPVCIVLSCIHGNFDALLAATCIWTTYFLVLALRSSSAGSLLLSSYVLSFGIAAKTFPLVLVTLFAAGVRKFKVRECIFAATLAVSPFVLLIGAIRVIGGNASVRPVLSYASVPGYFGITGIFRLLGYAERLDDYYAWLFRFALFAVLIYISILLARDKDESGAQIYSAALLLLQILILAGPGYGPQYLFWIVPFIAVQTAALWHRSEPTARNFCALALLFFAVSSATILYEYAFSRSLSGTFAFLEGPGLDYREAQKISTLLRGPLFVALLLLAITAARVMVNQLPARNRQRLPARTSETAC